MNKSYTLTSVSIYLYMHPGLFAGLQKADLALYASTCVAASNDCEKDVQDPGETIVAVQASRFLLQVHILNKRWAHVSLTHNIEL